MACAYLLWSPKVNLYEPRTFSTVEYKAVHICKVYEVYRNFTTILLLWQRPMLLLLPMPALLTFVRNGLSGHHIHNVHVACSIAQAVGKCCDLVTHLK